MSTTKFTVPTTDSCTISTKAGNLEVLEPGTKLMVSIKGGTPFEAVSGFSTKYQLCFQKGSPGSKQFANEMKAHFVKGQTVEVTVEIKE